MAGTRRTISIDALDNFAIDDDLILYWDGELVQTMAKYSLNWWQQIALFVTAASTLGMFIQGFHLF
jgi:hypothetical protein